MRDWGDVVPHDIASRQKEWELGCVLRRVRKAIRKATGGCPIPVLASMKNLYATQVRDLIAMSYEEPPVSKYMKEISDIEVLAMPEINQRRRERGIGPKRSREVLERLLKDVSAMTTAKPDTTATE